MSWKASIGLERPPNPVEEELKRQRVVSARANRYWREVEESALVRRPPAYFVHADTDELFTVYRGSVFTTGMGKPSFNERVPLVFYVSAENQITFLEPKGRTWSEVVAQRARRGRA